MFFRNAKCWKKLTKLNREYQHWKKIWKMKIQKVKKKKVKGKVILYLLLPPVLVRNKTVNVNGSVLVVTETKNVNENVVEIDSVKGKETEAEVGKGIAVENETAVEKGIAAVTGIAAVNGIAAVTGIAVDANEVALLNKGIVITGETKTGIAETAKIGKGSVNQKEKEVNEVIGKNPTRRRIARRVALLRLILKLQKQMLYERSWV